ncbi:MAG: hypothetical protein LR015_12890 [Verrucomicrobia bacterium]|nr:hypothetical protein [Verrucomicrobiota bacterium]
MPYERGSTAQNMAADFALLGHFPSPDCWRWRWYGWTNYPAFTIGYRQDYSALKSLIQSIIRSQDDVDVCRRPTGGGLVDHRRDVTLALVIPPQDPLFRAPPLDAYRKIHQALATALCAQNIDCCLQPCAGTTCGLPTKTPANQCFVQAEPGDIILAANAKKILGSA